MIVLWLLVLRGITVELRTTRRRRLARLARRVLCLASALSPFSTEPPSPRSARVPLQPTATSSAPLTTGSRPAPGILDWYTSSRCACLLPHAPWRSLAHIKPPAPSACQRIVTPLWFLLAAPPVVSLIAPSRRASQPRQHYRYPFTSSSPSASSLNDWSALNRNAPVQSVFVLCSISSSCWPARAGVSIHAAPSSTGADRDSLSSKHFRPAHLAVGLAWCSSAWRRRRHVCLYQTNRGRVDLSSAATTKEWWTPIDGPTDAAFSFRVHLCTGRGLSLGETNSCAVL